MKIESIYWAKSLLLRLRDKMSFEVITKDVKVVKEVIEKVPVGAKIELNKKEIAFIFGLVGKTSHAENLNHDIYKKFELMFKDVIDRDIVFLLLVVQQAKPLQKNISTVDLKFSEFGWMGGKFI